MDCFLGNPHLLVLNTVYSWSFAHRFVHMEAVYETAASCVAETLASSKGKAKNGEFGRSADALARAISSLSDVAMASNDRFESSTTASTPADADSAILKIKERYEWIWTIIRRKKTTSPLRVAGLLTVLFCYLTITQGD